MRGGKTTRSVDEIAAAVMAGKRCAVVGGGPDYLRHLLRRVQAELEKLGEDTYLDGWRPGEVVLMRGNLIVVWGYTARQRHAPRGTSFDRLLWGTNGDPPPEWMAALV